MVGIYRLSRCLKTARTSNLGCSEIRDPSVGAREPLPRTHPSCAHEVGRVAYPHTGSRGLAPAVIPQTARTALPRIGTQIGPGMPDTTHNDTRRRGARSKRAAGVRSWLNC
ncbi:hypothetical protein GCM10022140_44900 [Rhodococcus aetherivorans]